MDDSILVPVEDSGSDPKILGFPRRFNSKMTDPSDKQSVLFLLNYLWSNVKHAVGVASTGTLFFGSTATLNSKKITLPSKLPQSNYFENVLVQYIQDLLDLNGYMDMVVVLNHREPRDFEILTIDQFRYKFEYPMVEYQVEFNPEGVAIMHPKIDYIWIWVASKIGYQLVDVGAEDVHPLL